MLGRKNDMETRDLVWVGPLLPRDPINVLQLYDFSPHETKLLGAVLFIARSIVLTTSHIDTKAMRCQPLPFGKLLEGWRSSNSRLLLKMNDTTGSQKIVRSKAAGKSRGTTGGQDMRGTSYIIAQCDRV